ncbi:MAG TPA: patatin-like phospholipase family protein, partial [Gemmataceae bacterium]|nr:patatin-like phospholipase family protein [Gemmataceae bacterium]
MIGLALSGGGSRAIAFHLGCLRALHDDGLLNRVSVLSTISGGSVIGAYYAYTPQKSFDEFETDVRRYLRTGFERNLLLELLKPWNLIPSALSFTLAQLEEALAVAAKRQPRITRRHSRTELLGNVLKRKLFPGITMLSPRRNDMDVVIGACELRTGSAFRFGNRRSGGWRHGEMVESNVDVALAVTASAAYPIFLPALDRTWIFRKNGEDQKHRISLTDGGVYDNLGIQALEPDRDPGFSIHKFPCEYLIACNAGQGQELGYEIPMGFFTRVGRSFGVVHRRVQDSTMHRLHHLKQAGLIK